MMHFQYLNEEKIPKELKEKIIKYQNERNSSTSEKAPVLLEKIVNKAVKNHRSWLLENIKTFINETDSLKNFYKDNHSLNMVALLLAEIESSKDHSQQQEEKMTNLIALSKEAKELSSYFVSSLLKTGFWLAGTLIPLSLYLQLISIAAETSGLSNFAQLLTRTLTLAQGLTSLMGPAQTGINNLSNLISNLNQTLASTSATVTHLAEGLTSSFASSRYGVSELENQSFSQTNFLSGFNNAINTDNPADHAYFSSINSSRFQGLTNSINHTESVVTRMITTVNQGLNNASNTLNHLQNSTSELTKNVGSISDAITESLNEASQVAWKAASSDNPVFGLTRGNFYLTCGVVAGAGFLYYGSKTFFAYKEKQKNNAKLEEALKATKITTYTK